VEASHRTGRRLYRIPLEAGEAVGNPEPLTDDDLFYQGFSLSDQELAAISHGGKFDAGGDIKSGAVDLGSAMQRMNGINNQAINTGNDANVLSGLAVHIHLY